MARISGEMLDDVARGVGGRDPGVLELVVERDQLVDKLYLYMARQITMAMNGMLALGELGVSSTAEVVHLFLALKSMERVADHATIMSQRILGGSETVYEEASSLGYRSMLESEATRALGRGDNPVKFLIIDSLRRIVGYSLDILEAAIDISTVRRRARE